MVKENFKDENFTGTLTTISPKFMVLKYYSVL